MRIVEAHDWREGRANHRVRLVVCRLRLHLAHVDVLGVRELVLVQ